MLHKCSFSKNFSLHLCFHLYFSGMSRSGALQMLHNGTFAGINRDGERGPSYFSSSFFLYCLLTRTGDSMRILDTLCRNVEYWVLANNKKANITCEVLGRFPRIWGFYIFRKICRNRYVQYKSFTSSSSKTKKKQNEMRRVPGIKSNALGDQTQPSIQQQHWLSIWSNLWGGGFHLADRPGPQSTSWRWRHWEASEAWDVADMSPL